MTKNVQEQAIEILKELNQLKAAEEWDEYDFKDAINEIDDWNLSYEVSELWMREVGAALKEKRNQAGLSLHFVAEQLGTTPYKIRKIENGGEPQDAGIKKAYELLLTENLHSKAITKASSNTTDYRKFEITAEQLDSYLKANEIERALMFSRAASRVDFLERYLDKYVGEITDQMTKNEKLIQQLMVDFSEEVHNLKSELQ